MNRLTVLMIIILIGLQGSLWFGKGSVWQLWQLNKQLAQKTEQVEQLKRRNNALAAEINDLKMGDEAIEERARNDLGMIRPGEVFFQLSKSAPINPSAPKN